MMLRRYDLRRFTNLIVLFGLLIPALPSHAVIYYVSSNGNDSNAGTNWAKAKATVNAAVGVAVAGDQVWVAKGTYTLSNTINLSSNVALYGGFSGTETALGQRHYATNVTTLDGNASVRPLVQTPANSGGRTRVDGFTFQNSAPNQYQADIGFGGTVTIANNTINELSNLIGVGIGSENNGSYGETVTIVNNSISGNASAIFMSISPAPATSVVVSGNRLQNTAFGAVFVQSGACTLLGNTISHCGYSVFSGVDSHWQTVLVVSGNPVVSGNMVTANGGCGLDVRNWNNNNSGGLVSNNIITYNANHGLWCDGGFVIKDNLVANNSTFNLDFNSSVGAGIAVSGGYINWYTGGLTLLNNTIVDNYAGDATGGGGVWIEGMSSAYTFVIANNLVAFNSSGFGTDGSSGSAGSLVLATNDVYGSDFNNYDALQPGANDISIDPVFVDNISSTPNFHLTSTSPCINAGTDSYVSAGDVDLDGNPRIYGAHVDIGAYEWSPGRYPSLGSLVISPLTLASGQTANLLTTLTSGALPGGATVTLVSSNPTALPVPSTITVTGGADAALTTITAGQVATPQSAVVSASYRGLTKSVTVTVNPPMASITFASPVVISGTTANGTILLNAPAASAFTINLSVSDPSVAVQSVPVVTGQTSVSFAVTSALLPAVKTVTITATVGLQTLSANLTLDPSATIKNLVITPTSITGGLTAVGIVTLTAAAPAGGVVLPITNSNPAAATAPQFVTIPAGHRSLDFAITTNLVSASTSVTFTAALAGGTASSSAAAKVTLLPAVMSALTLVPAVVEGGENSIGVVQLTMPALLPVLVTLSGSALATPDVTTIVIPTGSLSATFNISTLAVTAQSSATIKATLFGASKTAVLTLTP